VEEVLKVITNQAARVIGTHQSVTSMTIDQNWAQAINSVFLSDKYAQWQDYHDKPNGSGIYACVCHFNRPMRMTQAELEAHPLWNGFGQEADRHPPLRGWLAAPLTGRDGRNIGLIQLSDKYEGEFTEADESILVQLAQMASVSIENARLYEAEQQARSTAEVSREEAQAANRVKDEFLAVLSHELRSPLNPILGWSSLLLNKKLDAAQTTQALKTIQRNAKLQSELIEDLLDVSRILSGKMTLNVGAVNLATVVESALETVRLAAEAKQIQIQTHLMRESPQVSGDAARLQQIVWNLLSNAVKFTSEGGQIDVWLEHIGQIAQIRVTDSGKGISPTFLPHVFDYFRQEDGKITRKFGGLGLGLAIVRHLTELHGGTVHVDSPGEGKGTTFAVQLPLTTAATRADQDLAHSAATVDLSQLQIVVVDDEADMRELAKFILEQHGAQVITVASAAEVLTRFDRNPPDVLISDIGMPEVDGYMLLQQIRQRSPEQGGSVPAIALTAYAGEYDQRQALKAGFQKHLPKPVEPDTLVEVISELVRKE
jgi:signal transduction histidine kinase/ActR/RegA family two-component response regulator